MHYEQQGTGFGLAIVRLLAELSGGTLAICRRLAGLRSGEIQVESEPDKGSVFTLTLPVKGPMLS